MTDIVSGHVSLEIEGFDRLYLNRLGAGAADIGSDRRVAALAGIPDRLTRCAGAERAGVPCAGGNQIPWVVFRNGDRKLEVKSPRPAVPFRAPISWRSASSWAPQV